MLDEIKPNTGEEEVKIYFTGPMHTQAERIWNRMFKKELEKQAKSCYLTIKIFFSQDMAKKIIRGANPLSAPTEHEILEKFSVELDQSKIVVTILDGSNNHNGVLLEASPHELANKKIIGILTDPRKTKSIESFSIFGTLRTWDIMEKCDKIIEDCKFNEDIKGLAEKVINQIIEFCVNPA